MSLVRGTWAGLAAGFACLAMAASAEPPRSAIPWLSESLAAPGEPGRPETAGGAGSPLFVEQITVAPIDGPTRDALGILPAATTGLSQNLWGPTDLETARRLVLETREGGVPAAQALLLRLLLAEADPPVDSTEGDTLLTTRIDRLLREGALEQADALILYADPSDPELFRRWFDVALLTNNAEPACEALRRNPSLSPSLPARVFCLARGGDWNAAEITLTLGEELGSIPEDQDALLARFLDPVLFEEEPAPPVPEPLTPLDFLMREAVGLPRPPGQLPLAFLHPDLGEHTPMRTRIEAAERLVRSGAIGPAPLMSAYRAGTPAASGGLWDRAAAVQDLDAALAGGDPATIATELAEADSRITAAGLRTAFAQGIAAELAGLPAETLPPGARARILDLLLLAGETEAAAEFVPPEPTPNQTVALEILDLGPPSDPRAETAELDARATAVRDAFSASPAESLATTTLAAKLREGRQGEVILEAIDMLAEGSRTPPQQLTRALSALRETGQEETARRIAVEILLQGDFATF